MWIHSETRTLHDKNMHHFFIFYTFINNESNVYFISSGVEYWPENHTSLYENSELKVLKNIKLLGQISNNLPNDLLATNVYKTLESCLQSLLTILKWTNTDSSISKRGTFAPFSSLIIFQKCFQTISLFQALKFLNNILSLS